MDCTYFGLTLLKFLLMDSFISDLFHDKAWHNVGMSKSKSERKELQKSFIIVLLIWYQFFTICFAAYLGAPHCHLSEIATVSVHKMMRGLLPRHWLLHC